MKENSFKLSLLGLLTIATLGNTSTNETSVFDKKMILTQKKMISANKNFEINDISISNKKKIDNKWSMYVFDLDLKNKKFNRDFHSPMIIFTDGKYQTNSLMDINTGERLETVENNKIQKERQIKTKAKVAEFKKNFKLNTKYYDEKHLILGKINAKNKVIIISDPLCVACIGMFPKLYNDLKNREDFALFYYHFPLKNLHPTAITIVKAMELASKQGIKNIEKKVYEANFDKLYDVYSNKNQKLALNSFNKVIGTTYILDDLKNISVDNDMKIAAEVKLRGTPTILLNGSLYKARERLFEKLESRK